MTILVPLLFSLAANSTAGYSQSELRTLQHAVNSYAYSSALENFFEHCHALDPEQFMVKRPDNSRLQQALRQQLQLDFNQFTSGVANNRQLQQRAPKDIALTDCNDSKSYLQLLDKYDLELFALEIATPLKASKDNGASQRKQQQQAMQQQAGELLARSKAIVRVSIIDRNSLSTLEQANFLHPDYTGRYIYKVEQGWRNVPAKYMGMQSYLTEQQVATAPKSWLLLLDQHNQFIKVFSETEAKVYLDMLGKPDWRFDSQGNLQRK
ncbi:hypothetical protein [Arsukibacterium ikkense]|uniref:hypothetical protein n=1 Tax=Arsukibacterium ikkense TaxID=336831 RepID=UPI000699CE2E|nr:hypothetical protein [Arsukibacterium ikkense]